MVVILLHMMGIFHDSQSCHANVEDILVWNICVRKPHQNQDMGLMSLTILLL